jgi:predicted RNA-binding Zn ribbon-like protein
MEFLNDQTSEPRESEALFVTFANTLTHTRGTTTDAIADAGSLLGWLREQGLLSARGRATEAARLQRDPEEAQRRLERFQHLREVLHRVAGQLSDGGTPDQPTITELNHILRHGLHYHQLSADENGARYEISQVGDRLDQARAAIATSFAHFLADDSPDRLRVCANEGCRWVFVDRSPAGRRRWCDMRTCGNQAKAARHRARAKAASGVSAGDGQD